MPQPCTTLRPCRSLYAAIIARGTAEPPTSIPFMLRQVPLAGVRVEQLQHPEPDRRHAGRPGHLLLDEVLEQALGVEVRAREDELRAEHRREVRVAPRVRVEHRHDRAAACRRARCAGRAARSSRRRARAGSSSGASRRRPCSARSCRSCSTSPPPRARRAAGPPTRPGSRSPAAPRTSPRRRRRARSSSAPGTARAAAAGCGRRSRPCRSPWSAMYAEVVRVQAQVQRVEHEPAARDPEVRLQVLVVVPAQRGDAVAALEAELLQGDGELLGPPAMSRYV